MRCTHATRIWKEMDFWEGEMGTVGENDKFKEDNL